MDFGKTQEFKAIPAGNYVCTFESIEKVTNSKGDPMYKFTLQVSEGEHSGAKLWNNISLGTQKSRDFLKSTVLVPFELLDHEDEGSLQFDIEDLIGTELIARVSEKEYPAGSGRMVNNVEGMKPNVGSWE